MTGATSAINILSLSRQAQDSQWNTAVISACAHGRTGHTGQSGWQGVHYPNASTDTCCFNNGPRDCTSTRVGPPDPCPPNGDTDCNAGCLYEVRSDPTEHKPLHTLYPEKVQAMIKRIEELKETAFTPVRCSIDACDDGYGNIACGAAAAGGGSSCADPRACEAANRNGGFWGPFIDVP